MKTVKEMKNNAVYQSRRYCVMTQTHFNILPMLSLVSGVEYARTSMLQHDRVRMMVEQARQADYMEATLDLHPICFYRLAVFWKGSCSFCEDPVLAISS